MEKILKDRLNHLKSKYQDLTHFKLTKTFNITKINMLKAQIDEVKWLINKYNKENEKS